MGKNAWFKHYNTASLGASFECLRADRNFEVMACYWMLLELVSRHEVEERRGEVELPKNLVHKYWNVSTNRAHRIMQQLMVHFAKTMRIETSEENYKIFLSNWLELQETRGGKRKAKSEQKPDRGEKGEIRVQSEEGSPSPQAKAFRTLFSQLALVTQDTWNRTYGPEFVQRQGALAYAYFINEPGADRWPPLVWASKIGGSLARDKAFEQNAPKAQGSEFGGWAEQDGVGT